MICTHVECDQDYTEIAVDIDRRISNGADGEVVMSDTAFYFVKRKRGTAGDRRLVGLVG